jgi:phosphatidylserine/phosphatidylglycerophosphate/cardiolipin synthase-like enzyme
VLALLVRPSEERIETAFAPSGERRLLEERISAELRRAEREVCVALFRLTSDRLVQALGDARRRGVPVRVLLDAAQADEALVARLRSRAVDVRRVTPRGDAQTRFHHKYAVLDGRTVVTGSYNWTVQGDMSNHENLVILRDEKTAAAFRGNFEGVWNDPQLARP